MKHGEASEDRHIHFGITGIEDTTPGIKVRVAHEIRRLTRAR